MQKSLATSAEILSLIWCILKTKKKDEIVWGLQMLRRSYVDARGLQTNTSCGERALLHASKNRTCQTTPVIYFTFHERQLEDPDN